MAPAPSEASKFTDLLSAQENPISDNYNFFFFFFVTFSVPDPFLQIRKEHRLAVLEKAGTSDVLFVGTL